MKVKAKGRIYDTKNDIILDSFRDRRLNQLVKVPIIAIYKSPKDYPGMYVARLWDINDKPTKYIVVDKKLSNLRRSIPTYMTRIDRYQNEDRVIVESYI